jgi:hypothetical protein
MTLFEVTTLIGGLAIMLTALTLMAVLAFFVTRMVNSAYRSSMLYFEMLVLMEMKVARLSLLASLLAMIEKSAEVTQQLANNVLSYILPVVVFTFVTAGMLVLLTFQPQIAVGYAQLSQCGVAPLRDGVLLPLLNTLAFLYDIINPLIIFFVRIFAFFTWLNLIVFASCASISDLTTILKETGLAVEGFFTGFIELINSGDPLNERWDVMPFFYHAGQAFIALRTPLACYCTTLDFVSGLGMRIPSFLSVATCGDCMWNVIVRTIQLPLRPFFGFGFSLVPWADEVECVFQSLADVQQDVAIQAVQAFIGTILQTISPCPDQTTPNTCAGLGYCTWDYVTTTCRNAVPCDQYLERDLCNHFDGCCWSANVNVLNNKTIFTCLASDKNECPAGGAAECPSFATPSACVAHPGVCFWDPRQGGAACQASNAVCTQVDSVNVTSQSDCILSQSYCAALTAYGATGCGLYSNQMCAWNGTACLGNDALLGCYGVPDANQSALCLPYQLCAFSLTNATTGNGTCIARDIFLGTGIASVGAASASSPLLAVAPVNKTRFVNVASGGRFVDSTPVNASFTIPPPGSTTEAIAAQFGVNALLTIVELQWAHVVMPLGIPFPTDLAMGAFRAAVQFVENIANMNVVFGTYDGIALLRIGFIMDHVRNAADAVVQAGFILDVDLPCTLQPLADSLVDFSQGLVEIFFLIIYFALYQPTGPYNQIYLWSPLDFLPSYYNDTRVSFTPLVFLNGVSYQWSRDPVDPLILRKCAKPTVITPAIPVDFDYGRAPYQSWYDFNALPPVFPSDFPCTCTSRPGDPLCGFSYYDITILDEAQIIVACSAPGTCQNFSWVNNEAVLTNIGATVQRVEIFPGLDRSLPQVINDIINSGTCANLLLGNGQPDTQNFYPWACFVQYLLVTVRLSLSHPCENPHGGVCVRLVGALFSHYCRLASC